MICCVLFVIVKVDMLLFFGGLFGLFFWLLKLFWLLLGGMLCLLFMVGLLLLFGLFWLVCLMFSFFVDCIGLFVNR